MMLNCNYAIIKSIIDNRLPTLVALDSLKLHFESLGLPLPLSKPQPLKDGNEIFYDDLEKIAGLSTLKDKPGITFLIFRKTKNRDADLILDFRISEKITYYVYCMVWFNKSLRKFY
ncbi:hypothetical protein BpHYR1_009259 [Brachionus plicatilis]|uniref:Uncharacterized protein n=1 Tax=Brachionus plicatilis TaxID=10195 RepID=A0A3M7PV24_BRAPC|nr:hypothetical protein BpHYR1_009259 [Brachionus plicatilis]